MFYQNLALLSAFVVIYSIFAGLFERRLINGPFLFVLVGLALGPAGLGILMLSIDGEGLRSLAELTLAVVLFTDAANAHRQTLQIHRGLPLRLLLIGLPLTLILGWAVGLALFPGMPWLEIALLATILAPTDAALGKAVVSNTAVPAPIRESLNVESGLNDGICVPVLLVLLSLLGEERAGGTLSHAVMLFFEELGLGALIGTAVALMGCRLMNFSALHRWRSALWSQLTLPAMAMASFAIAQCLGASGFIAAFVGGLVAGTRLKHDKHELLKSSEGYGDLLSVLVWVLFGAIVIPKGWSYFTPEVWLYALASLTFIRMIPVWLCLLGSGLNFEHKLFIGWFGPRGLASIVFGVMVIPSPLQEEPKILAVAICTIMLSVVLHGISANPWVDRIKSTHGAHL